MASGRDLQAARAISATANSPSFRRDGAQHAATARDAVFSLLPGFWIPHVFRPLRRWRAAGFEIPLRHNCFSFVPDFSNKLFWKLKQRDSRYPSIFKHKRLLKLLKLLRLPLRRRRRFHQNACLAPLRCSRGYGGCRDCCGYCGCYDCCGYCGCCDCCGCCA